MRKQIDVLVAARENVISDMLCKSIGRDPSLRLVGRCCDVAEAEEAARLRRPDVVALDMQLPGAWESLSNAVYLNSTVGVVAMSSATGIALEVLDAGAMDFIYMPDQSSESDLDVFTGDAIDRIKSSVAAPSRLAPSGLGATDPAVRLILVYNGEGGLVPLGYLLARLPAECPPVLVMQKRQALYPRDFANRLQQMTGRPVQDAEDGMRLAHGNIAIANADQALDLAVDENGIRLDLGSDSASNAALALFSSAAGLLGPAAIAVALTHGSDLLGLLQPMARVGALAIQRNKNAMLLNGGENGIRTMVIDDIAQEIRYRLTGQ